LHAVSRQAVTTATLCGSQLLINGTPIITIVVGPMSVSDGEAVWSSEFQILARLYGELRPHRDTSTVRISAMQQFTLTTSLRRISFNRACQIRIYCQTYLDLITLQVCIENKHDEKNWHSFILRQGL